MKPILTTGTVTMTRNVGQHLLITLALAAAGGAEDADPSLASGNEITVVAPLNTAIPPNGTVFALRLADAQVDEKALASISTGLKKQLADANAANADALDAARNSYEKEIAALKAELADSGTQLNEAKAELDKIRSALPAAQASNQSPVVDSNQSIPSPVSTTAEAAKSTLPGDFPNGVPTVPPPVSEAPASDPAAKDVQTSSGESIP